jgi:quinol monooxygenase YgiN
VIIVAGHIDVAPEQRDEFLAGREQTIRASRSEPGCIEYVFSADALEPGRVRVFERWESKEALRAHLAALQSVPPPAAPGVPRLATELVQYEAEPGGALGS